MGVHGEREAGGGEGEGAGRRRRRRRGALPGSHSLSSFAIFEAMFLNPIDVPETGEMFIFSQLIVCLIEEWVAPSRPRRWCFLERATIRRFFHGMFKVLTTVFEIQFKYCKTVLKVNEHGPLKNLQIY